MQSESCFPIEPIRATNLRNLNHIHTCLQTMPFASVDLHYLHESINLIKTNQRALPQKKKALLCESRYGSSAYFRVTQPNRVFLPCFLGLHWRSKLGTSHNLLRRCHLNTILCLTRSNRSATQLLIAPCLQQCSLLPLLSHMLLMHVILPL